MKVKRINLNKQLIDAIKMKIFNKEYKLGQIISIEEIKEEFSVSNTPVREALSSLIKDNLVELQENHKYKIISLSDEEIINLNELILVFIFGSIDIILKNGNIEELKKNITACYEKHLEAYRENNKFNYDYVSISTNFDREFVMATKNKFMIQKFDEILDLFILATIYNKNEYRAIHLKEHRLILEALDTMDYLKVKKLFEVHFSKSLKDMNYSRGE